MGFTQRHDGLQYPLGGGSFAVESVAGFAWNRWQLCRGISGSFRMESVAGFAWNRWQASRGIGGSFRVEYAVYAKVLANLCERAVCRSPS